MTENDLAPVTLMIEMRERLVRIETKMDSSAEKTDALQIESTSHAVRLSALEAESLKFKSSLATIKWLAGAVGSVVAFVGIDVLLKLFH